jgi:hypothetical protein
VRCRGLKSPYSIRPSRVPEIEREVVIEAPFSDVLTKIHYLRFLLFVQFEPPSF